MRRALFWFVTSAVLGLCCHVAYVLFMPSRNFSAAIDAALADTGTNKLVVLANADHMNIAPFAAQHHIVGLCKFDLRKGAVRIVAEMPEGFWTFAVYSIRGKQVYAINDTQADTNQFSVSIFRDGGLLSQFSSSGDEGQNIDSDQLGWRISMPDAQGVAILWMAVADPLLRPEAISVIAKSRCLLEDG